MPIDYSQPGYQIMFANYGQTVFAAQALEKTLWLYLAAVNCRDVGKETKSALQDALQDRYHDDYGKLLKALRAKVPYPFSPELDADLDRARTHRNYVVHHFFFEHLDGRRLTQAPEQIGQELRPIWELLNDVQARVDALCEAVQKQLGVSQTQMELEAQRLRTIAQGTDDR